MVGRILAGARQDGAKMALRSPRRRSNLPPSSAAPTVPHDGMCCRATRRAFLDVAERAHLVWRRAAAAFCPVRVISIQRKRDAFKLRSAINTSARASLLRQRAPGTTASSTATSGVRPPICCANAPIEETSSGFSGWTCGASCNRGVAATVNQVDPIHGAHARLWREVLCRKCGAGNIRIGARHARAAPSSS